MLLRTFLFTLPALLQTAAPVLAHEFWIEPKEYQVESGAPVIADLRNGERFKGSVQAYFDKRTARFDLITAQGNTPYTGRMGDIPALQSVAGENGLLIVVHQTEPSTLTYPKWEKFLKFAAHKDFKDIESRHIARGVPKTGFKESYSRFAKSLVAVGSGTGEDVATGMETEFVALTNPYTTSPQDGVAVQLLYHGAPRPDAQIEVFERKPDGSVLITLQRSDAEGKAIIPVVAGHDYLLDAVVLRPMPEGAAQVWETLWAALSFSVP